MPKSGRHRLCQRDCPVDIEKPKYALLSDTSVLCQKVWSEVLTKSKLKRDIFVARESNPNYLTVHRTKFCSKTF
jgi:hypothetical protein